MKNKKEKWEEYYLSGKDFIELDDTYVDELLLFLGNGDKIKNTLDIGCGTGQILFKLAERGVDVVGVDISPTAIEKAKERFFKDKIQSSYEFYNEYIKKISVNKKFDLVILKLIIAITDDKDELMETVKLYMKENGHCLIVTPIIFPDKEYSERIQRISIYKDDLYILLKKHFNRIDIFKEEEFDNDVMLGSYLVN